MLRVSKIIILINLYLNHTGLKSLNRSMVADAYSNLRFGVVRPSSKRNLIVVA
jgi:peptidyl-tRNA hydrolase